MFVPFKGIVISAIILIGAVFIASSYWTDRRLRKNLAELQDQNHQRISRIVAQSLDTYFKRMQYVTENISYDPAYMPSKTEKEDELRDLKIKTDEATRILKSYGIKELLPRKNASSPEETHQDFRYNWQIFKGLPEKDSDGKLLAAERRIIARRELRAFPGLHYVFQLDRSGEIVFLEPFEIQKNIRSYKYDFRDYLQGALSTGRTVASEGYISQDAARTQIITVATPIRDELGKIIKVVAASVSSATLRDRIFKPLREEIALQDDTLIYLIDHHGHVVASSAGPVTYFPNPGAVDDRQDIGNFSEYGPLTQFKWDKDAVFEKGNEVERRTWSWQTAALKLSYSGEYNNWNKDPVFGTFYPISILGGDKKWGILVETPTNALYRGVDQLKTILITSGALIGVTLLFLGWLFFHQSKRSAMELALHRTQIESRASNAAHDLGSPLLTLRTLLMSVDNLPENVRTMFLDAISRLSEISDRLSSGAFNSSESSLSTRSRERLTLELIPNVLSAIITEKRLEYRSRIGLTIDFEMTSDAYGLFATINRTDFERVISNIVNNSVEAIKGDGCVKVTLARLAKYLEIVVADDGEGIPSQFISKAFERGSTSKPDGRGIGLYLAKRTIESFKGSINLSSRLGKGTSVSVKLKLAEPPSWFCSEIKIPDGTQIRVIDDDKSIHDVWDERLSSCRALDPNLTILHFSSPQDLIESHNHAETNSQPKLYLVDHEFPGASDGLALIKSLAIANESILVTSHDEEDNVRLRAEGLGVKIIPKSMAAWVPIVTSRIDDTRFP